MVRVNVKTETEAQTFLVDPDDIDDEHVREAVEYANSNPEEERSFGPRITVNRYGEILQDGYEMNEALRRADTNRDVDTVYVDTA